MLLVYPSAGEGKNVYISALTKTMEQYGLKFPGSSEPKKRSMRKPNDAVTILSEAGFEVESIRQTSKRYHHVDDREYIEWAKGTGSANWGIPKELEEKFNQSFIENYLLEDPSARGSQGQFSPILNYITLTAKNVIRI